jgi:L-histidine N-alpha-methyltransferase
VHGIVGDYEQHLEQLPNGGARLFLFLGSTIGNFEPASCVRFLRRIAGQMKDSDFLLIGTDTLKDTQLLNAAYNDAQGVTAAFNKNLLSIINRELDAEFDTAKFQHVAFFDEEKSQIEMYLEARVSHQVRIRRLGMTVGFRARERILTEISRKFTRSALEYTLHRAGLELDGWFVPDDEKFALSLTTRAAS